MTDWAQTRGGAQAIADERQRQIEVEGYVAVHDDRHDAGELVAAAIAYARLALGADPATVLQLDWPWEERWFKPSPDAVRNLAKAGALIAAEIDRLIRESESKREHGE